MTKEAVVVEDDELDDVFEDESTKVTTDKADETKDLDPEAKADETKDDKATGEKDTAPPAEEAPKSVPIAALHDERRKRKLAEEEADTLRQQLPPGVDTVEPDRFDDPEAHDKWLQDSWQRKQDAKAHAAYVASVEDSRSRMLEKHDDFKEVERIFYVLAQGDPALTQEMIDSKDPAAFAYEKGNAWKAEQRKTIIAELEAEGYTKKEAKANADDIIDAEIISETKTPVKKVKTPSLATVTAAAPNTQVVEKEESIEDICADQSY